MTPPGLWHRLDGAAHLRRVELAPWRVVESQSRSSTRKLVDSLAEQELLEELVEQVKPPVPTLPGMHGLHYLLSTPFRHPPLRNGSRFGTRHEPSIYYGSKRLPTALAEVAYYRLLFLEGTRARLAPLSVELTAFRAKVRSRRAVELTRPPFDAARVSLTSKTSYAITQALGRDMRASGVELFVFESARDPDRGQNVGLFAPVFAAPAPTALEGWSSLVTRERVEFVKQDVFARRSLVFERAAFELGGELPSPAT
ncbi:MAG: RES family NAD+ phosphorylase [Sorangiineae bacterium]|nr:RES family NAD+ phosphorylase [Polyangiaceae bacterium]MEB2323837.1 RES family NAD+ phosphorylase [Sorangiineae bacterium]